MFFFLPYNTVPVSFGFSKVLVPVPINTALYDTDGTGTKKPIFTHLLQIKSFMSRILYALLSSFAEPEPPFLAGAGANLLLRLHLKKSYKMGQLLNL